MPRPACGPADPRATGSRCTGTAGPRASGLPALAPQEHLERQKCPQRMPVVASTCAVLREQRVDGGGGKMLLYAGVRSTEVGGDIGREVLAEPAVQRDAEPALAPLDDL